MYNVSVSIGDIEAENPSEAAQIALAVLLRDYAAGFAPLYVDVTPHGRPLVETSRRVVVQFSPEMLIRIASGKPATV